jgi:hypothetical protein
LRSADRGAKHRGDGHAEPGNRRQSPGVSVLLRLGWGLN